MKRYTETGQRTFPESRRGFGEPKQSRNAQHTTSAGPHLEKTQVKRTPHKSRELFSLSTQELSRVRTEISINLAQYILAPALLQVSIFNLG